MTSDPPRKTLIQSYLALSPRQRLYFGIGGVAVSLAGMAFADYLERNSDLAIKGKVDEIAGSLDSTPSK
ncbi:hypothetical protein BCR44DRAFT_55338 [Catenaria anguillulae PL171]|uniref:Uncharacterized protein n=1 Tax=Catenaria anguillulae PL171 TaxID=765915 RepID=A0A1Y2I2F0_9FUNG|nr:hypothetical protein BCR44DRAFT_55338 [Catenaria anguillulae PL171]